jgi:hypothetical protein
MDDHPTPPPLSLLKRYQSITYMPTNASTVKMALSIAILHSDDEAGAKRVNHRFKLSYTRVAVI